VNDGERQFIIAVTMLNRLLFAYIVGQIASLIAALDRQAALVQEKLDQIREYLQWRGTPKELSVRIKRYYEFFYQKQAVFDEKSILKDLSPALHAELLRTICADTISRLPLFAKLSPDFQKQIFPYIKPLSFDRGDYIFRAGSVSDGLVFLLEGEVNMLSKLDDATPERRIKRDVEVVLSTEAESRGEQLLELDGVGCFGQEVLVGLRRHHTAVAHTKVESLIIEKADLITLFKNTASRANVQRICTSLLHSLLMHERLRKIATAMRRSCAPDEQSRAVFALQRAWRHFVDREAQRSDELCRLIQPNVDFIAARRTSLASGRVLPSPTSKVTHVPGSAALPAEAGASPVALEHQIEQRFVRLEQKQDQLQAGVTQLLEDGARTRHAIAKLLSELHATAPSPGVSRRDPSARSEESARKA